MPIDYKRALAEMKQKMKDDETMQGAELQGVVNG
jgi:hypothetical protein